MDDWLKVGESTSGMFFRTSLVHLDLQELRNDARLAPDIRKTLSDPASFVFSFFMILWF